MNAQKFTQRSLEAIRDAQELTVGSGNQQIEQIHLFSVLLEQESGLVPQLLQKLDVTMESLRAAVRQELGKLPKVTGPGREADRYYVARSVDQTLNRAEEIAGEMHDDFVSVEHLLLALLDTAQDGMKKIFTDYRIDRERILAALQTIRGSQRVTSDTPEETYDALK